jgi:hypothetical protein
MYRVRALAIALLLLSYGAVGARQPAVRTSVPLPVAADLLAQSLGLDPHDRSQLLISIIRLVFDAPDGLSVEDQKPRTILAEQLKGPSPDRRNTVPLPLDTSIWRETLLNRPVGDAGIAAAILSDRTTALLYHGLAALDEDTLGWLGPDRETLLHLRRNPGVFAAFGRSIQVRAAHVSVPGGREAEPLWTAIVGADPAKPAAFVQRLVRGNGRLAWFYDTVMHLDGERQRLVLGRDGPLAQRVEKLRDLLNVFEAAAPEWQVSERPFVRPALDPSLVLSLVRATRNGRFAGPDDRVIWEMVFRDNPTDSTSLEDYERAAIDSAPLEPAWLTRRMALVPTTTGRRRLETFLFAQRVFTEPPPNDVALLGALRGAASFPALAFTLERMGITSPQTYAAAARAAGALNAIRSPEWRRVAIAEFQGALAILDRSVRMGGIERKAAEDLVATLVTLPISMERGFNQAFAEWLRLELVRALPVSPDADDPLEDAILSACAGVNNGSAAGNTFDWEGRTYRVDPAATELKRLRLIRAKQRRDLSRADRAAATLDTRLDAAAAAAPEMRLPLEQALAESVVSIVYAVHLGEPDGAAASAGDVARRHDFHLPDGSAVAGSEPWRLPREEPGHRSGWRVVGSLLGLDIALGRLALRRLDLTDMPGEPTMSTSERASATLTAVLFGPIHVSDDTAAEIAAAIKRGRTRVAALRADRAELEDVARDAGLNEWRREALGWTLEHEPENSASRFSLVELFWLGSPRGASARAFDAWGAATAMLDGSLCLRMPDASAWEARMGRASAGHLATQGADISLRVAELVTELKLSPALAPAIVAYAMQDVIDRAHPAFFDDWQAFQRTARDLPRERLIDYVAAVAAESAMVPEPSGTPARF